MWRCVRFRRLARRGRFRCGRRGLLACFVWCVVRVLFGRCLFLRFCRRVLLLLWALRLLLRRGWACCRRLVVVVFLLFLFRRGCAVVASSLAPVVGSVLPPSVVALVAGAGVVGFSGSRSVVPACVGAVCGAVSPRALVGVGCASGVDAVVRALVLGCSVFSASSFAASSFSGRLVLRSVALVRFVASASGRSGGGVFVVFPSAACPVGLVPSSSSSVCFRGLGSGSWASAAFAAGLGVPVLVFSPVGVPAWGFSSLGGGWFLLSPSPSLF